MKRLDFIYYADGVPFNTIAALAKATGACYGTLFARFKNKSAFIFKDINYVRAPMHAPEKKPVSGPGKKGAKAARPSTKTKPPAPLPPPPPAWTPSRLEPSFVRRGEKPRPLFRHGHITHGINLRAD